MPFDRIDPDEPLEHFQRHGHEFHATSPEQYEEMADAFWSKRESVGLHACNRKNGSRCRYDERTEEYSVKNELDAIVTYYKPVPCLKAQAADQVCHPYSTNLLYFRAKCR